MDCDQTCIKVKVGGKSLLDFGDLDLIFKVTVPLLNEQNFISTCYLLNCMKDSDQNLYN